MRVNVPVQCTSKKTVRVLSHSNTTVSLIHTNTDVHTLTEEVGLQNYPGSFSVVKGTVTPSNTSTKK